MKWKIFLVILVVLAAIFLFTKYYPVKKTETISSAIVAKVLDGDTVELASGKQVRLIGIDAPEKGKPLYSESRDFLKNIVENKEVKLEGDIENADKYGRLLRYIYADDRFVNLLMLQEGYAAAYSFEPNQKYAGEFREAEKLARQKKLGIWKTSEFSDCIELKQFNYNAQGDDNKNLNDEYVVFQNVCDSAIALSKWTVADSSNRQFTFPEFSLAANGEVTLFSGEGTNSANQLYWNNEFAIWNNDGDTLSLRDSEGNLVLSKSYAN